MALRSPPRSVDVDEVRSPAGDARWGLVLDRPVQAMTTSRAPRAAELTDEMWALRSGATRRRLERDYMVVVAPEELDVAVAGDFALRLCATDPNVELVVEMAAVTYCGAAGIAALIDVRDTIVGGGGTFTLRRPTEMVERLLAICGELDRFVIAHDRTPRTTRTGDDVRARRQP